MKLVFVLRHAKAEKDFFGSDHERKLTDRGKTDIAKVAQKFKTLDLSFDCIIASTAQRVKQTVNEFMDELKLDKSLINYTDKLFHAPAKEYYSQIKKVDKKLDKLLIVAHNPGITDFINSLGLAMLDHLPTSGIFGFVAHCDNWADFEESEKEFLYFDYPKA